MSSKANADVVALLAYFLILIALILGWILNLVKLFGIVNDPINGMFILRCIGIPFAPLGSILGYL